MAKEIPTKEFKAAITALNVVLKAADGETAIKIVAVKKEKVIADFTNKILDYIENEKAGELPDIVVDFYNEYIVGEDADEPEDQKGKAKGKTGGAKGKTKGGKGKAKPKAKPEPKVKGPLIITEAISAYMDGGCKTAAEIVAKIGPTFPDRKIAKTVSHIFGVLRHIPPNKK